MIIFNGKELPSQYSINDNMILEINSTKTADEIYEKLRKGEDLSTDEFSIHAYINGSGKIRLETENMPAHAKIGRGGLPFNDEEDAISIGKDAVLTEDEVSRLQTLKGANAPGREELFEAFEKYQFGLEKDGYKIKPYPFDIENPQHKEVLRRHIALAYGVMPNVYSAKSEDGTEFKYTLKEGMALSKEGQKLYRDFGKTSIGQDNDYPSIEDIEYLASMNEYEKRLMARLTVHPMKLLKLKKALEEKLGAGAVLSSDYYTKALEGGSIDAIISGIPKNPEDKRAELENAFQEEYHFVPKVLDEYLMGATLVKDKSTATELAKAFSRPSVSAPVHTYTDAVSGKEKKIAVAQTKNPALIYLSSKLNFAEIPQQLTKALSVFVNASNIGTLEKKGLSTWIKANKNTPVADFVKMLENESTIDKFDPELSAEELSNYLDIALGKRDCALFERMYGYNFKDNEIAIKGRNLVIKQGNITMRMLKANDYKNFVTGYDSCCCQRWDDGNYHNGGENYKKQVLSRPATLYHNAGGTCVAHLTSDPFAANVVIERNGKVVGQSYVWTDEPQGIFVFDNIEWANDGDIKPYLNIIGVYAKNLPYPNVQLGMGCTQGLNGVGDTRKVTANMPHTVKTGLSHIYSDYHGDARDLKRVDGRSGQPKMVKFDINENACQVINAPDEPTKWDVLASPQFSFMLNDNSKTLEERLEIARQFQENPTVELQKKVFSSCPTAILAIENPDPGLQLEMYQKHPDIAKRIAHPCPELMEKMLLDEPDLMRHMENVPEELALRLLSQNGMLLQTIANPTDEEIKVALAQDGYAFMYEGFDRSRLTEELMLTAVTTSPRVVTLLPNPSEEVQMKAIAADPEAVVVMDNPCIRAQMSAVRRKPELIMRDMFKNAPECVVRCAVESNPSVIGAFQFDYPELRMEAINRNGFVIRDLQNVTTAEYEAAVRQNPNVARFVTPPTGQVVLANEAENSGFDIEIC